MKKNSVLILVLVFIISLFTGCGSKSDEVASGNKIDWSKYTIGFSQDTNDIEWTQKMKSDITETCKKNGIKLSATVAGGKASKQVSDIEDLISMGVNVLLIHTYHASTITNAVKDAQDAKIPVIVLASEIPGVDVTSLISTDSLETGKTMGNYVVNKFKDGANIIQITGKEGSVVNNMRGEGFRSVIDSNSKFKVLAQVSANYERSKALTAMEDQIQAHSDQIKVVYCHNDDMALGAIKAIEDAGYKADVDSGICVVSAADGLYKEVLDAVQAGKMVSGYFPTFGKEGVETAMKVISKQPVDKKIMVKSELISKDNVSKYR